jgi:threonine dehydratase
MPATAPIVKVNATRSYGAQVILTGEFYDEAFAKAKELEKEKGYVFVHPYQDPYVIAGQGTIGLEILDELPDVDTLVIPIGGGGLISGIATVAKAINPSIKVIGVVSNQAPGMMHLYHDQQTPQHKGESVGVGAVAGAGTGAVAGAGTVAIASTGASGGTGFGAKPASATQAPIAHKVQQKIATIAEGIAIKSPSPAMYETYISSLVDEIVSVTDDEIAQTMVFLLEKGKTVTEGAGAAALAAIMKRGSESALKLGKKTCVVFSGGNVDLNVMAQVIERGLRQEHRLARLSVVAPDLPGNLSRITNVMAEKRANILEVYHDRVSPELALRETRIDLLVETSSDEHIREIQAALKEQGFKLL